MIPSGVTTIADSAFSGCPSLSSITIPNSVTTIGDYAFYGCTSLSSITIPDGVTTIGDYAFDSCSSLSSITIPDGVTNIGNGAFLNCRNLSSITIPNSVTTIGDLAFRNCTSLTSITIPSGVTTIGNHAFNGCSSLISITIPESVTSIGDNAFHNCRSLTKVEILNPTAVFGTDVFASSSVRFIIYGCTGSTAEAYAAANAHAFALLGSATTNSANVMFSSVGIRGIDCTGHRFDYVPGYMFDGYRLYNKDDSSSYCDFKLSSSKEDVTAGIAPRYNLKGETGQSDSIYLAAFIVELDDIYTVDRFSISLQQTDNPSASIDGFDILLSSDGTNWSRVISVTELVCDRKFTTEVIDGFATLVYSTTFPAAQAKYVAFGLTQPRCQHADALAEYGLTPNVYTNYFRITEFELFKADLNTPDSTAANVTLTAPDGGWVEGTNTFSVKADLACAVVVSYDGGQTYTRLSATANADGSYNFTAANMTADTIVAVAVRGDSNGDGKQNAADLAVLRAVLLGKIAFPSTLQEIAGDGNSNNKVEAADLAVLRAALLGKISLGWN